MVGDGLRPQSESAGSREGADFQKAALRLLEIPCFTCPELGRCVPERAATCKKLSAVIDGDP